MTGREKMLLMGRSATPLATRVEELFTDRWPRGNKVANALVADYVSRAVGRPIDRQYIYRIRTGRVRKVDVPVLEAIGRYFDKNLDYFSGEATPPADELDRALAESGMQIAGLRGKKLTEADRLQLARLVREANDLLKRDEAQDS